MASKDKEIKEPDTPEYMELMDLYENTGELTAKAVVAKARNPKSAMHSKFEWDDSVASEKYREAQAYRLINRYQIKVIRTGQEIPVPMKAFMMPQSGSGTGAAQSHHPSVVVLDDDWKYNKQLVRLETKLLNLKQEIDGFTELKSISTAITKYFSRQ